MAILGKLINTGRNALLIALAVASIGYGKQATVDNFNPNISPPVASSEKKIQDDRLTQMAGMFQSPINNPYNSFDSNVHFLQEANDYFGSVIDFVADEFSLSDTISGRVITALLYNKLNGSTSILSHEIGHYLGLRRVAPDAEIIFKFPIFYLNGSIFFGMDYPDIKKPIYLYDKIFHIVSGLNINELEADAYARNTLQEMPMQDAFSYLHAKLMDDFYSLADYVFPDPRSDLRQYLIGITNVINDIPQSQEELTLMLLLPDLLSMRVYDAIDAIRKYIATGEMQTETSTFSIGENILSYPDISTYLTPQGIAYNLTMQMKGSSDIVYCVSIAGNPFYPLETKFDDTRFALGLRDPSDTLSIETAVTYGVALSISHISLAKTIRVQEGKITAGIEYSSGDLIENIVKGKRDGIILRISADIGF